MQGCPPPPSHHSATMAMARARKKKAKKRPLVKLSDYIPFIGSPASDAFRFPLPVFAGDFDPDDLILCSSAFKQPNREFAEHAERLLESKFKIMSVRIRCGMDVWTLASQIVNPYEVVPCVAAPALNRAFFKMWELVQMFHLVPTVVQNPRFLSAHLCEAPGGFVQAVLGYRSGSVGGQGGFTKNKEQGDFSPLRRDEINRPACNGDSWFSITLATCCNDKQDALEMQTTRLRDAARRSAEGYVHYGADKTGDITNPANITSFVEFVLKQSKGVKMPLITGDGAVDVSDDFSVQEQCHASLVFCEMVTALKLQALGGSLVLKLFDCFTETTATVIFILSSLYSKVEIVRLCTSRVCNSERYVVAQGFRGLMSDLEERLLVLTDAWRKSTGSGTNVAIMLSTGLDSGFLDALCESNVRILKEEVESIDRAFSVAEDIGERLSVMDDKETRKGVVSILRRKLKTLEQLQSNAQFLCRALCIPSPSILS